MNYRDRIAMALMPAAAAATMTPSTMRQSPNIEDRRGEMPPPYTGPYIMQPEDPPDAPATFDQRFPNYIDTTQHGAPLQRDLGEDDLVRRQRR